MSRCTSRRYPVDPSPRCVLCDDHVGLHVFSEEPHVRPTKAQHGYNLTGEAVTVLPTYVTKVRLEDGTEGYVTLYG